MATPTRLQPAATIPIRLATEIEQRTNVTG
jgi:hypothetical protein